MMQSKFKKTSTIILLDPYSFRPILDADISNENGNHSLARAHYSICQKVWVVLSTRLTSKEFACIRKVHRVLHWSVVNYNILFYTDLKWHSYFYLIYLFYRLYHKCVNTSECLRLIIFLSFLHLYICYLITANYCLFHPRVLIDTIFHSVK